MKHGCFFALLFSLLCGFGPALAADVPSAESSPVAAAADDFAGTYTCHGFDPYEKRTYTGSVVIIPDKTVYKLDMVYDTGDHDVGTGGMYSKDLLSVVFQNRKDLKHVGLEQYHFSDNNSKISGFWVYLGKNQLGREVCERDKK